MRAFLLLVAIALFDATLLCMGLADPEVGRVALALRGLFTGVAGMCVIMYTLVWRRGV